MDTKDLEAIEGKVCSKCGTWKLLEEYNKNKRKKILAILLFIC